MWSYPYCCGFAPLSGRPGPLTHGARRVYQFVGDDADPILMPQAAEVVKRHGEIEASGIPYPTPHNQCSPEEMRFVLANLGMQMIQQPDRPFAAKAAELKIPLPTSGDRRPKSYPEASITMSFSLATTPFSSTSDWNTPIPAGATYTQLNWPAFTGYNYNVIAGIATYVSSPSDPIVVVSVPAGWGYRGGTVDVQLPSGATGTGQPTTGDAPLVVVDGDIVYDFWQFNRTSDTTATASAYGEANVATGTGFGTSSPFLSAGISAIGSNQLGGELVAAQTDTGVINHALELQVDSSLISPGAVGPAIASDGGSTTGIVQEGELLAIPQGTPMPAGLSPLGQEVFTALENYGAYVVDQAGGVTQIMAQSNGYSAATLAAMRNDMGAILPLLEAVSGGTKRSRFERFHFHRFHLK
jgi:hypothetical protein